MAQVFVHYQTRGGQCRTEDFNSRFFQACMQDAKRHADSLRDDCEILLDTIEVSNLRHHPMDTTPATIRRQAV